MDIENLIEQLNRYFEGETLPRGTALDAATALSTLQANLEEMTQRNDENLGMCRIWERRYSELQAENEKLRETVDKYATAARVIALHLKPFCDESLPYDEMIADAARKASDELEQVKRENDALWTYIEIVDREYRRYMDRGYIDRLDELRRTWKSGSQKED